MKRWIGAAAFAVVIAAVALYYVSFQSDSAPAAAGNAPAGPPPAPAMPVVAALVEDRPMPEQIATIGTVEPVASVRVRPRLDSEILQVRVQEGQSVKPGQVLFELDSRHTLAQLKQSEAALARDRAQLANARRDLGRMNDRLNSRQQIDQAQAAVEALQAVVKADEAMVEAARVLNSYTVIRAPIGGRLGAISQKVGNSVRASDAAPLVTINQLQPIYVAFAVPQQRLTAIRDAMAAASLAVAAVGAGDSGNAQEGKVAFIDNAVDEATGTVKLRAVFANDKERLWPGAQADVVLTVRVQPDARVIPARAIQQSQSGPLVFVIKADQTVETRPVTLDRTVGEMAVIAKGLQAGERVVVEGQLRLVPGARVEIVAGDGKKAS
jgi:multidrug efflux system membrane fusion protein